MSGQKELDFGFLILCSSNLDKKALTNIAIPFPRDNLPGLVSNIASNVINKSEIWKRSCEIGKRFTLFILHEDIYDIIKIAKPLEDLGALSDGVLKQQNMKEKKQEVECLGSVLTPLAASLVQPRISSVVNGITGRGVRRAGRGYDKIF